MEMTVAITRSSEISFPTSGVPETEVTPHSVCAGTADVSLTPCNEILILRDRGL
jgi:hypothetical protein